ncbi:MAG: ImmA/IrrE family metallo-endopeptidase [Dehalococcoidia bacterium]
MRQLSLLEIQRALDPGASDAARVAAIAAGVIAELGEEPPVSLEVVASYRDIRVIRTEPDLPCAGSLTPEPRGLVIRLRASDNPRRRRFSGFHEIGHTFQPGYREATSFRCEALGANRSREETEKLADVASTELLLPRSFFEADARELPFRLESVIELADRYEASVEATALRYVTLRPQPTLLVVLAPGLRKAERADPEARPKLRVLYSAGAAISRHVPRNKSAAEGGPLHRAWLGELVNETGSLADLSLGDQPLRVSAQPFSYLDPQGVLRERVLALYEPVASSRKRAG